jgi:murein tripeptide amidase MpaA
MVNEYIAWMLLSTATGEAATYLNKFDFFIFPFSNPDGKFSRAVTTYSF